MRTVLAGFLAMLLLAVSAGCGRGKLEAQLKDARDSIAELTATADKLTLQLDSICKLQKGAIEGMIESGKLDEARRAIILFGKSFPDSSGLTMDFMQKVELMESSIKHEKEAKALQRKAARHRQERSGGSYMVECPVCRGTGKGVKMMGQPAPDCCYCGGRGWVFARDR